MIMTGFCESGCPAEEAEALKRLMDDHAYQQDQLARIIGKSPATISVSLSLNKLPKEIRDECRQDPTVPKKVLVEIAQKKQERGMLTQFKKYRDQQEKAAARQTAASTTRKRTKAEALANQIGALQNKIGDLDFPSLSTEDREMVTGLDLPEGHLGRSHPPGGEEQEKTDLKMIGAVGRVLMMSYR